MSQIEAGQAVRIVLVEDSREDAELVIHELRASGFDVPVRTVAHARYLREALAAGACDAVISDYHVPGFGAAAALSIAQDAGFDGPFIVVSGMVGEEEAVALMKAGAHDFVMKNNLARLGPALTRELRDAQVRRERRRAQAELELREAQLRELTEAMRTLREEEQARIARELHDELGQILTALKLDLTWLVGRLGDDQTQVRDKLISMRGVIDAALDAVRRIAADLRPAILDDLGLAAAVEWQLRQLRELTGAQTELRLSHDEFELDERTSITAYRVVQECLTNIARHARAHKVTVRVDQSPTALALEISDDGAGIDFAQIGANGIVTAGSGRRRSFGLLGLRERVTGLGGEFRLHSRPGAGTTVRVQIPRTTDSNPGVAA